MTTKHDYETTEGTKPTTHGAHEPRTVVHTATAESGESDVYMMSEIGDGVFVAWENCRKCAKRIGSCKCPDGPAEPPYVKPWRDDRFKKDLNTRPDPSYDLLPSVIEWVESRGYTVSKSIEKQLAEAKPLSVDDPPGIDVKCRTCGERYSPYGDGWDGECPDCADKTYAAEVGDEFGDEEDKPRNLDDAVGAQEIDAGLNAALEKVRAARDAEQDAEQDAG